MVRRMRNLWFKGLPYVVGAVGLVVTSGCATALKRSDGSVDPGHVYPAATLDAQLFWDSGVRGEPLFATADPAVRNGPAARLGYCIGAIIDAPFSIVFDTILLPVDLIRSSTPDDSENATSKSDTSSSQVDSFRSETNALPSAAGSHR